MTRLFEKGRRWYEIGSDQYGDVLLLQVKFLSTVNVPQKQETDAHFVLAIISSPDISGSSFGTSLYVSNQFFFNSCGPRDNTATARVSVN